MPGGIVSRAEEAEPYDLGLCLALLKEEYKLRFQKDTCKHGHPSCFHGSGMVVSSHTSKRSKKATVGNSHYWKVLGKALLSGLEDQG